MEDEYHHHLRLPIRIVVAGFLLFLVSGCASLSRHDIHPLQDGKYKIAVLPINVTAHVGKLSDIESSPPKVENEKGNIQVKMDVLASRLDDLLLEKFTRSDYYHAIPISAPLDATFVSVNPGLENTGLKNEIARLRKEQNVQAVLKVDLEGYGELKRQWIAWLIGSGVVEGIVQGVATTEVLHNQTLGLAVGLEEIGQEILEWGGGAYLFNSYYSPVTIAASLYSTKDGKKIWSDTIFVSSDDDALKLYPKEQRDKRQVQLRVTAYKAIDELHGDLESLAVQDKTSNLNNKALVHHKKIF